MRISDHLAKYGLYGERAYNMGHINIRRKSDDGVEFVLEGSELSKRNTVEETIAYINEKINERKP